MKVLKVLAALVRIIVVGLGWWRFYVTQLGLYLLNGWNFRVLNKDHWAYIYEKWQGGWVIDEPKEMLFVGILAAFIPLGLLGWWICDRIVRAILRSITGKISGLFDRRSKAQLAANEKQPEARSNRPKGVKAKPGKKAPVKKKRRKAPHPPATTPAAAPAPQPAQPEAVTISEQPQAAPPAPDTTMPVAQQINQAPPPPAKSAAVEALEISASEMQATSASQPGAPAPATDATDRDSLIEHVKNHAKQNGYIVYSEMEMGAYTINLVLIANNKIMLVNLGPDGPEWVADEESFSDEPPVWFSEDDFTVSPVHMVLTAQSLLEEMLAILLPETYEVEVIPAVTIGQGTILNAQTMVGLWKEYGVEVARFASGQPEQIAPLETVVPSTAQSGEIPDDILNFISLALVSVAPDREDEE